MVKNPPANAGDLRDVGLIPGWGRWPGAGNGNPLQYSSLENPMDRGAWWATVYRVTKSRTWMNYLMIVIYKVFKHDVSIKLYFRKNVAAVTKEDELKDNKHMNMS